MWRFSALSLVRLLLAAAICCATCEVRAATIRSWSGSLQTGGDFFIGLNGPDGYAGAKVAAADHTVMSGISTLTVDQLRGVDVFLWGVPTNELTLSEEEAAALLNFVQSGGVLLLESDSGGNDRASANNAFEALGLGRPVPENGLPRGRAGSTAGTFSQVDSPWLNGAAADLRGKSFGSTQASYIPASEVERLGGSILGGIPQHDEETLYFDEALMAEFKPFSSGGSIIFMGDPYLSNRFTQIGGAYHNSTNASALQNLLSSMGERVQPDCDLNGDSVCDAVDIDLLSSHVRNGDNLLSFDLNADQIVDTVDREVWVKALKKTWFGDADLSGAFDTGDLVLVFQAGEYEDDLSMNSGWAEGDWDGNGDFGTGDLVYAFQDGGFEVGPLPSGAPVPEPAAMTLVVSSWLVTFVGRRRNRC